MGKNPLLFRLYRRILGREDFFTRSLFFFQDAIISLGYILADRRRIGSDAQCVVLITTPDSRREAEVPNEMYQQMVMSLSERFNVVTVSLAPYDSVLSTIRKFQAICHRFQINAVIFNPSDNEVFRLLRISILRKFLSPRCRIISIGSDDWKYRNRVRLDYYSKYLYAHVTQDVDIDHYCWENFRRRCRLLRGYPLKHTTAYCDTNNKVRRYSVSYIGSHYGKRKEYLSTLSEIEDCYFPTEWQSDAEHDAALHDSKILVNFSDSPPYSSSNKDLSLHMNGRTFDSIAAGALLMDVYSEHLPRHLRPHIHYVPFFSQIDLKIKILELLRDSPRRLEIATRGQKRLKRIQLALMLSWQRLVDMS